MPKTLLKSAFYAAVLAVCLPSAAQQTASFDSLDGTLLKALVFHPDASVIRPANQSNQASRGTVIALHGCGGLYAATGARKGQLNARHQAMADLLVAEGYSAVFPDSFSPRGETELCTQKIGKDRKSVV